MYTFEFSKFILFLLVISVNLIVSSSFSISKCSKTDSQEILLDSTTGKLLGSCEFINVNDNNPKELKSGNVYSWLGVPYAEPPIGANRFKRTVEKIPWIDPLDAKEFKSSCIQQDSSKVFESSDSQKEADDSFPGFTMWNPSEKQNEDCLYLNIFAPAEAYLRINIQTPSATSQPLKSPILVFFHGGGTTSGSSVLDIYDPSTFVAASNTIVITVNYRLGVFGFLHLDGEFPGNQALWDQHEALKWIKANAERFGGDPSKITIVGHSAGATLVGYQLLFKESWPLFKNAILQSGTPLLPSLLPIAKEEAHLRAKQLFTYAGCFNETSTNAEIAACAQNNLSTLQIAQSAQLFLEQSSRNNPTIQTFLMTLFPPIIDSVSLVEPPVEALRKGNFKRCPILTGFTTDEGSAFISYTGYLGAKSSEIKSPVNVTHEALANLLSDMYAFYPSYPHTSNKLVINSMLHEYTKLTSAKSEFSPLEKANYFHTLSRLISEQLFICPAYSFIDLLSKYNKNIYLYLYAHRISSTPWPNWFGVTHGDDLAVIFANPISSRQERPAMGVNPWANPKHKYTNGEKQLTNDMISYWANFARFGTPNKPSNKHWPEYVSFRSEQEQKMLMNQNELSGNHTQSGRYMIFKTSGSKVNRGFSLENCQYWNSYLPNFIKETGRIFDF